MRMGLVLSRVVIAVTVAIISVPSANVLGQSTSSRESWGGDLTWRFVGPVRGGRTEAVVGDPSNGLVFYFGSAHGGVWKTTDAGLYWHNVSDGYFKTAPVGAIDISQSSPSVVYVGMGEALNRQDIVPGDGVYKTTDGGKSWTNMGLQETEHIAKIRIDPTDPDVVYVAARGDAFGPSAARGVYRSRDGGKTWKLVLHKSDRAGALDLVLDPSNPKVLYASLDEIMRLPWDDVSGGPDSGLYKSTDGGDTWTEITRNPGLPKGIIGKIGLSISASQPNRVWALIEADEGGLYRSEDAGATWQLINSRRDLRRSSSSYMHVIADPQDADTVYLPTYQFQKSVDGGKTFVAVPNEHGDNHALWIDPQNNRRMIEGNDGGATISLDGGLSWSTEHNQPTADLFSLAVDDQYPYWLYAAQNDEAHIAVPSRTNEGAIPWMSNKPLGGGEGGLTAITPDGNIMYGADRAYIYRYDRRTGQTANVSIWPDDEFTFAPKDVKYRFYYTVPLLLSPHDPGVLYAGGNHLFRTSDEGKTWEMISPDLTGNHQDKMQKIPGGPITSMWSSLYWVSVIQSIAESPIHKGELWVGTDDSKVQVTKDGGKNWEDISPMGLGEWTTITSIDVSAHDPGTAYIAANRYRVSDRAPYFYKTTDYGHSWQKITSGIGEKDFSWVIREDPKRRGLLYAGTETGAYISFDAGAAWQPLQRNLPVVQVRNMQVKGNDLVVATHGRGFWIMDNISVLRQITPEVSKEPAHLFEIAAGYRYLPVQNLSPNRPFRAGMQYVNAGEAVTYEDQKQPDGELERVFLNGGANPPEGVMIDYALQSSGEEVTLTILDAEGHQVRKYSSQGKGGNWMPAQTGANRLVWDLQYPAAHEIPAPPGFGPEDYPHLQPTIAPPGHYTARLSAAGHQYDKPFEIRRDPRVIATDDDLRAQFELMQQIATRTTQITEAVDRLRSFRQQLGASASPQLLEQLHAIEATLTRLPSPATPNRISPKALNNRLAALAHAVQEADARPTKAMEDVFQQLSNLIDQQISTLNTITQK